MFEPLINVICQLNFNAVFLLPDHFGGFWYAFFLFCSTLCNLRAFSSVSSYSYTFFLQALNAKMAGIKYKTYEIASRNRAKGSNVALELDIGASKIRSVDVTLFNAQGVTYILPVIPLDNVSGDYSLGYAVNVYINTKKNLFLILAVHGQTLERM